MAVERGDQEGGVGSRRRDAPPTRLRDFDGTVMPLLGGFGQYQKRLILLTWIPAIFIGFSQSSDSFFTAEPDFSCRNDSRRPPGRLVLAQLGGRLPNGTGAVLAPAPAPAPSPSHQHPEDNSSCQCTERDYILRAALTQNIVTKWNLVCDSSWMVHIAKFSLLVGLIIGYLVTGCLADWFGRQLVLAVSIVLMLIFGLMVALSVNVTMFSTLRFFEGFSLAGIFLTLYATRIELSLPRNRFMITMTASFITMGGQLLMPGLAVLCRDWQILQAIIICPFIFMLSYWCIFPESLRWLLATHQLHAAKDVFLDFAHKNRVHLEDDIKGFLTELDKEEPVARHNKTCIVKIIHTRILWKHILVLCVNSLTGFGIHYCFVKSMMDHKMDGSSYNFLQNFYAEYYIMEVIGILSCAAMCGLVSLMGRRGTLLLFTIITALASLLQLGLINYMSKSLQDPFSVTFSIVGMFASHAVGNLSIFFCAELTPTVIRGGGLGLVLASAGFGRLTAPIMELHNQKGYFLHHVIFTCCTMICIICILLLPESRGLNLPETIDDGDNYTRQPLLPPKKAEQPLLANQTELKDYSGLQEIAGPSDSTAEITTANGNGIRSI
ncbi:solute carrier family 22 member 23 [Callorhinchus milii]|uniref:solute carrier family 22 member 23 n=1 Tax=Callorhinchus milii TaxID=7868 RepID=UPI0004574923|nr:solute carrier family 22 member 23 [Callorhinchus milii]|eukprot:gi/632969028/ref/XP_007900861.1/ PREDICTED: solute carrier family 22 member 23 [Callorhinchus milii]